MTREEALKGAFCRLGGLLLDARLLIHASFYFARRHDDRPGVRILHRRHPRVHHAREVRRLCRALEGHHDDPHQRHPFDARCCDVYGRQAGVWLRVKWTAAAEFEEGFIADLKEDSCTYYLTPIVEYQIYPLVSVPLPLDRGSAA